VDSSLGNCATPTVFSPRFLLEIALAIGQEGESDTTGVARLPLLAHIAGSTAQVGERRYQRFLIPGAG